MREKDPGKYTFGMILRLVEGILISISYVEQSLIDGGESADCLTLSVWQRLYKA